MAGASRQGLPLKADGTPNLEAPTPRTPDGKPDLTGVWLNEWFYGGQVRPAAASLPGEPPASTFGNIGANFPNGLPLQPWAATLLAERKRLGSKDNPDAYCLPMGLMQFHEHPQPRKMIQTPDVLVDPLRGQRRRAADLHRWTRAPEQRPAAVVVRLLDGPLGRRHAGGARRPACATGAGTTSTARRRPRPPRSPSASAALNYGTLKIDVTIDDPKAYTAPFTVRVNQKLMVDGALDAELIEFICAENEKDDERMVGK